jgi:hypothetical protein
MSCESCFHRGCNMQRAVNAVASEPVFLNEHKEVARPQITQALHERHDLRQRIWRRRVPGALGFALGTWKNTILDARRTNSCRARIPAECTTPTAPLEPRVGTTNLGTGRSAAGTKNPMFQVTAGWIDYPGLGELLGMKGAETIMSSRREMVRMPGRLQGMGHDVACTVFAEKVSLPGTDVYEYDRSFISGAPRDLPAGRYTLTFDRRLHSVQRHNGAWVFAVAVQPA